MRRTSSPRDAANIIRIALLSSVVLSVLAACSSDPPSTEKTLTIAWVRKSLGNPVFDLAEKGARQKVSELNAGGSIKVELVAAGPDSADAVAETRIMDDMIARGVSGMAVSCTDPTACINPIDRAVAAGIPVMTWDSDSPSSKRFTFLSIDNYAAGQQAADLLAQAIGANGKVAIITGTPGSLNLDQRVAGFQDQLKAQYPKMQVVRTVASNEDISVSVQGVEETMQAHPDLRGWFFAGLWALYADRGSMPLWEAGTRTGKVKTVSFDTLPLELDLLRDGYLEALIGQKYWSWGYDSVQMVYDYIVSGKRYPLSIDTGVDIVTRNNVDAMEQQWLTNDFSKPLPAP